MNQINVLMKQQYVIHIFWGFTESSLTQFRSVKMNATVLRRYFCDNPGVSVF